MNSNFRKTLLALSLVAGTTLLAGCGGSGGGTLTPDVPANTAPVITGDASPTAPENQTTVGTYTATDAQGDAITLSLSGDNAELFSIDASGNLSFVIAPDYENGDTGPYSLSVVATDNGDGNMAGTFAISVGVSDVIEPATNAVVQLSDSNNTSSQIAFVDGQTQIVTGELLIREQSDYSINVYQSAIYHIGRWRIDTIEKFNVDNLTDYVWSHTTKDAGVDGTSNPYSIVFANENKAYLLRYGSATVWIVNPSAQEFADFKIGELDLSAYATLDPVNNLSRMAAAVVNDGKLYITMQRLDDGWAPQTAYVAVFDTETDEEIETNSNPDDGLKGIPLVGQNPLENSIYSANGNIYVTTRSSYSATDVNLSTIEEINPVDYAIRKVIHAGAVDGNLTHGIRGSVIVSDEKGYFFTNAYIERVESSTLYEFNPTTGEITASDVSENGAEAISFITLDEAGALWVSAVNQGTPGIDLIDTTTNAKIGSRILTGYNPSVIWFMD
jgi:hypothetical protein